MSNIHRTYERQQNAFSDEAHLTERVQSHKSQKHNSIGMTVSRHTGVYSCLAPFESLIEKVSVVVRLRVVNAEFVSRWFDEREWQRWLDVFSMFRRVHTCELARFACIPKTAVWRAFVHTDRRLHIGSNTNRFELYVTLVTIVDSRWFESSANKIQQRSPECEIVAHTHDNSRDLLL